MAFSCTHKKRSWVCRLLGLILVMCCLSAGSSNAQARPLPCPSAGYVLQSIQTLDQGYANGELLIAELLRRVTSLKDSMEICGWPTDSLLALVWHKSGVYQNVSEDYSRAMQSFQKAMVINLNAGKKGNRYMAARSCLNFGYLLEKTGLYRKALSYFDTACTLGNQSIKTMPSQASDIIAQARYMRAVILYDAGDFNAAKQESDLGLDLLEKYKVQSIMHASLLTKNAEANLALGHLTEAALKNKNAQSINLQTESTEDWTNGLRIDALIAAQQNQMVVMDQTFRQLFSLRRKAQQYVELAQDLLFAGEQYIKKGDELKKGESYLREVISLGKKYKIPSLDLSSAWNNLGVLAFKNKQHLLAAEYYQKALYALLEQPLPGSKMQNPSFVLLTQKGNLHFAFTYLANKAEALMLSAAMPSKETNILKAALNTSMLADSIITQMRQEQTEESTKLFWRRKTKWFFANSLEICYLLKDAPHAFHFMEKSRAVLLNDHLNELGAQSVLPAFEQAREQYLRASAISCQIKMRSLEPGSTDYVHAETSLRNTKDSLRLFIAGLEKRFPAYYLYKYASNVPSQNNVQQVLKATGHSFIHYFTSDTAFYILTTSPNSSVLRKKVISGIEDSVRLWLSHGSDPMYLNQHYTEFQQASYRLYQQFFQPLQLHPGRVVVSHDEAFLPLEALPQSSTGKNLLIYDFVFSYAYSASFLLNALTPLAPARDNFLGLAPASFAPSLKLATLHGSKKALQNLDHIYPASEMHFEKDATKRVLIHSFGHFNIINLYSHARADSQAGEPAVFLHDSAVMLGELGLLKNNRTQLIVLSACQTSSGALARGEGIYSLARGFASAGIPAALATVWRADEKSVYSITQLFHQHLAQGLPKDVALQRAKIDFLKSTDKLHQLPFYWANITLSGSYAPIVLANEPAYGGWLGWSAIVLSIMAAIAFIAYKKRKARAHFH